MYELNFPYGARLQAKWDGVTMDYTSPSLLQFWSFISGLNRGFSISHLLPPTAPLDLIDVGACIGTWSIAMAIRHAGAHLLCLEPYPVSFKHLVRNLRGYDVDCRNVAAGAESGTVTIQLPGLDEPGVKKLGWYRADGNIGRMSAYGTSGQEVTEARVVRLDDIAKRADVIKIDVEGMEQQVLQGADRIIRESRPIIQCELREINQKRGGHSVAELKQQMTDLDYVMVDMEGADGLFIAKEKVP